MPRANNGCSCEKKKFWLSDLLTPSARECTIEIWSTLKVRIHGAILRAMAELHRVSTPKFAARNIAAVESRPTSATLRATNFFVYPLKVNFFVLLRVALLVLHASVTLSALKKQRKFCRYVTCSQWKGEFWFKKLFRACLDTSSRFSTIDEVVSRRCKPRNRRTGE